MHSAFCKQTPGQLVGYIKLLWMSDEAFDIARVFSNWHISLVLHFAFAWIIVSANTNRRLSLDIFVIPETAQNIGSVMSPGENVELYEQTAWTAWTTGIRCNRGHWHFIWVLDPLRHDESRRICCLSAVYQWTLTERLSTQTHGLRLIPENNDTLHFQNSCSPNKAQKARGR